MDNGYGQDDTNEENSAAVLLPKWGMEASTLRKLPSLEPLIDDVQLALQQWPTCKQIWSELGKQKNIGCPIAAMNVMWFSRLVVTTMFLGHLGGLHLAGGTLALTYANVTGYSILMGLSGGMEPLCSQAYGARQFKIMGLTLHRQILILLVTCIPVAAIWYNTERVLLFFGQDKTIAAVAKKYLMLLLPDLVAQAFLYPLRIYLRSQCITKPLMFFSGIAMIVHIPINFTLVFGLKLGAPGTARATCLTDFSLIIMLVGYMLHTRVDESWRSLSRLSFTQWMPLLKLSVPSCLMTCLEWWCYEIMILLTGMLPNAKEAVSAFAIVLNGDTILYAVQVALASCVCTRVGNELGANSPLGAYHASVATLGLSMGLACFGAIWLISARSIWGKLFTSDEKILVGVTQLLPIMGLMELGNFPQTVSCGVLKGSARPSTGAFVNLGAFYLVGLPLGAALAFAFKLGLLGLWIGLLAAVTLCAAMTVTAVVRTDWIHQAVRAQHLTLQNNT